MKTPAFILALVAASPVAHAETALPEPSTTLPEITVYPHPGALLIDRLSREIIADIGSKARLPTMPQQQAHAEHADSKAEATPRATARDA